MGGCESTESPRGHRTAEGAEDGHEMGLKERSFKASDIAMLVGGAVLAVGVGVGIAAFAKDKEPTAFAKDKEPIANGKTMKPPGGNGGRISRDDFEGDPASYFSDLRKKKLANSGR